MRLWLRRTESNAGQRRGLTTAGRKRRVARRFRESRHEGEVAGPLHKSPDRRALETENEITLPMPWHDFRRRADAR